MRLIGALLCAAMLGGCNVEADFSDNLKTETLSAEQYKADIVAIDRLVFQDKPLGDDGARALEQRLNDLSRRVRDAKADSKFLKLESLELRLLANRARSVPAAALQNNWMRIRSNLFDDQWWFARSAKDLDEPATSSSAPVVETTPTPMPSTQFENRASLSGRWQVMSILANGEPRNDEELTGSTWTFDAPRLVVRDAKGHEKIYNFNADREYLAVSSPAGEDGWMKYEINENGLRIAFFDGLKGKPSSFDPPPQRDRMLIVLRLASVR